ncbi:MAG: ribosomal-protein-alanine N-acetyltransferase [Ruminococcaceae bacterium]|nr:ribosomal-protein-alanine N-acetyltransferase [Oscillospiraceae bacterium]
MIIRKMQEQHLDAVLDIEENSFSHPWSRVSFEDELKKENSYVFVALEDEKVIGYCVMNVVLDEGNLLDIAVDKNHRRSGVAKELFYKLFEVASEQKLSFITLEVRVSNEGAIKLYDALGFTQVAVRKNYYSKPSEDAVLMTKYFDL